MDIRFATWNVRSVRSARSLKTMAVELQTLN